VEQKMLTNILSYTNYFTIEYCTKKMGNYSLTPSVWKVFQRDGSPTSDSHTYIHIVTPCSVCQQ